MSDSKLREARERIDIVVHEVHKLELDLRAGRPIEAARLREIGLLLAEVRQSLRRRRTPTSGA